MKRLLRLILLLWPSLNWAQGDVQGVVFDSLRTHGPLNGALIALDGTAHRARTDVRGRFQFPEVPPGRYTVRLIAPWLDSLSLAPVTAAVVVRDLRTSQTRLATPSIATYQRTFCGIEFAAGQGVLRGEVRDVEGEPRSGVAVGAVWSATLLSDRGLSEELVVVIDSTDAAGMFSLCGVPRRQPFLVGATFGALRTTQLTLSLDGAPGARHDLMVGGADRTTRLTGRVTTTRGSSLRTAVVAIPGDSAFGVRVDSTGRFAIHGLPRRTTQLVVRAVGFTPARLTLDLGVDEIELSDIQLDPVMLQSAGRAHSARTIDSLAFVERARAGQGLFVDDAAIAAMGLVNADSLARYLSGVESTGGAWPRLRLRRDGVSCYPRFRVDGVDFGVVIDGREEAALLRAAKRFEVHGAASTPSEYIDLTGCGVVLIWTL